MGCLEREGVCLELFSNASLGNVEEGKSQIRCVIQLLMEQVGDIQWHGIQRLGRKWQDSQ